MSGSVRVKSSVGLTDMIPVGVGLHQGSSLSPYLLAMIMDVLARGIKDISPWCMYADDIVLCGTRSEVVEKKLEEWRRAMEDRGLKINRKKTVYPRFNVDRDLDDGNSDVNIQGENLERMNTFKYLGATLAENGDLDAEMTHRIHRRMEKLEEDIGDFVGPKNKFESQGESIQAHQ